jgi:hypothetical protein
MHLGRKKVLIGAKKIETLLRKVHKNRDSDSAGPRKSGRRWERGHKSLNIANIATGLRHVVYDLAESLIGCLGIELARPLALTPPFSTLTAGISNGAARE